MGWLVIGLIIFLSLMYMGVNRIQNRYHHSVRSLVALGIEGAIALFFAVALVSRTSAAGFLEVILVLSIATPFFLGMAMVTVEVWRKFKQAEYDGALRALRVREADCLEKIALLESGLPGGDEVDSTEDYQRGEVLQRHPAVDTGGVGERRRRLEAFLDEWQSTEGLARVRSLRLREWKEELGSMDDRRLMERVRELRAATDDDPGNDQSKAQATVGELLLLERGIHMGEDERVFPECEGGRFWRGFDDMERGSECVKDEGSIERQLRETRAELGRIREEIEGWRRRREEFSRGRIRLD